MVTNIELPGFVVVVDKRDSEENTNNTNNSHPGHQILLNPLFKYFPTNFTSSSNISFLQGFTLYSINIFMAKKSSIVC